MRFEYLILLIILFNIVTAMAQKRAQKAKRAEEEARAASGNRPPPERYQEPDWDEADEAESWDNGWEEVPEYPDVASQPSYRGTSGEAVRRSPEERTSARKEQSVADRFRARADDSRRVRDEVRNVGAEEETRGHDERERAGKLAGAGRDLLERIARDLGIETQTAGTRRGEPPKTPPRRKLERGSLIGSFERITPAAPVRPTTPVDGTEAAGRARPFRVDLSGARKLREAVVVKEILDAPLSRRERRPGNGPQLRG